FIRIFATSNFVAETTIENIQFFMTQKQLYTAPQADLLVVRFEENILSGGDFGSELFPGSVFDIDDPIVFNF
ncbi:MAG: hypothetical protein J5658_04605, partial [Prevotella sp.]|nr:hypothetical protein [Prevotella sp.]